MKTSVIYYSRSGQTKKVADAIAAELAIASPESCAAAAAAQPMAEAAAPDADALVFFGLPIEQFGPAKPAVDYLTSTLAGRKVALFVTHSAPEPAAEQAGWLNGCREAAGACGIVGLFHCQGELAAPAKQAMLNSGRPDLERWARADTSQGQPDAAALDRARAFAREVLAAQS